MTPFIWLTLWLVAAVVLLILGAIGAYPVGYRRGYRKGEMDRPKHRAGDPQPALPTAGRLPVEQPPWHFAGESEQGWASESAEYELLTQALMCPDCHHNNSDCRCGPDPDELLTQTAVQPVSVTGEPPIDTGELLAITDRVESWIAQWTAQGNVDRHTIQAGD